MSRAWLFRCLSALPFFAGAAPAPSWNLNFGVEALHPIERWRELQPHLLKGVSAKTAQNSRLLAFLEGAARGSKNISHVAAAFPSGSLPCDSAPADLARMIENLSQLRQSSLAENKKYSDKTSSLYRNMSEVWTINRQERARLQRLKDELVREQRFRDKTQEMMDLLHTYDEEKNHYSSYLKIYDSQEELDRHLREIFRQVNDFFVRYVAPRDFVSFRDDIDSRIEGLKAELTEQERFTRDAAQAVAQVKLRFQIIVNLYRDAEELQPVVKEMQKLLKEQCLDSIPWQALPEPPLPAPLPVETSPQPEGSHAPDGF